MKIKIKKKCILSSLHYLSKKKKKINKQKTPELVLNEIHNQSL